MSCASSSACPRARALDSGFPVLHYAAPKSLLVFDHLTRGIALLHDGSEAERQSLRKEVIRALRGALPNGAARRAATRAPTRRSAATDHMAGVKRVQEYIAAGDVYQLVLSVRFGGRHDLHPFEVYRALRFINPSPYMYYCALGDVTVVGLLARSAREAESGSRGAAAHRGHAAARAKTMRDRCCSAKPQLRADPKENAEHVMLVDLARNDLGRVAQAGSVSRESLSLHRALQPRDAHRERRARQARAGQGRVRSVRRHVSRRHARRRAEGARHADHRRAGARRAAASTAAPSATSASAGDMDQAITIRTLVFRGDEYSYQAGGGIVADSVPEAEHDEVLAKSAAAVRALQLAEEGM